MIRKALITDAKDIHEAHMISIREICSRSHTPDEINAWGRRPYNETQRTEAIKKDELWVVELENKIEGFGHLRLFNEAGKQHAHLMGLYLTPKSSGKGFGNQIIQKMLEICRAKKVKTILLESSLNALNFYHRHGFKDIGEQKTVLINHTPIRCQAMKLDLLT